MVQYKHSVRDVQAVNDIHAHAGLMFRFSRSFDNRASQKTLRKHKIHPRDRFRSLHPTIRLPSTRNVGARFLNSARPRLLERAAINYRHR